METFTTVGIMFLAASLFMVAYVIEKLHTRVRRLELEVISLQHRVLELENLP